MNIKEYIASGILELYVAGSLSEKKNEEVHTAIKENPELLKEVLSIENAIVKLTSLAKKDNTYSFNDIKNNLKVNTPKVIPISKPKTNIKTKLNKNHPKPYYQVGATARARAPDKDAPRRRA